MQRITVYEHARTDKAILVHKGFISAEADRNGKWFPLSSITIISREHVKSGERYLGWQLVIDAPEHLL